MVFNVRSTATIQERAGALQFFQLSYLNTAAFTTTCILSPTINRHTLQAEPFLTVHILSTEKRLCTNRVKFLLSMRRALLRYALEPRPNQFSF